MKGKDLSVVAVFLCAAVLNVVQCGYKDIGCYKDTGNRAIQTLEGKDSILDGSYVSRANPIAKCAVAAMRAGYSLFAVQNGGWCAASATASQTFDKYGKSTACKADGEGGPWANQVYVMKASVQHGGWSAASSNAPQTFEKCKSTARKADGEGGRWGNKVYLPSCN